jgi:saccharopine dehydrogenase-like NADP-dependent oxidoreductase
MKNKVLLLGAGLVSKPLVTYLLKHNFLVTVASRTVEKAEALIDGHPNGKAVKWVVEEEDKLNEMVKENDIAISLLPYIYHLQVAETCLKFEKHLVTTSYVKDEMRALDQQAKSKNLLFLNEVGLDPGIDHMSAMKLIHDIWNKGGKVVSFESYCGALPAPESADNPLKYKFSWSPRGVLLAGRNSAKYIKEGKTIDIKPDNLFDDHHNFHIKGVGDMEFYPNRDSVSYIDIYKLEGISTMFRGTIRYQGWSELMSVVSKSGWLSLDEVETDGKTYKDITAELTALSKDKLEDELLNKYNATGKTQIIDKIKWMGLLSDDKINKGKIAPIDILTDLLLSKMFYKKGEKDMVILFHKIIGEFKEGKKLYTSLMIDYGVEGEETSVARTVALPAAIATRMILEDKIKIRGVHIPVQEDIYTPILEELENIGIKFEEKIEDF